MGRIAVVQTSRRVNDDDGHGLDIRCDPSRNPVTVPHYADPGDDSNPLPGDFAALEDSSGTGAEQCTGYADVRNEGKTLPGEKRIYARDADGNTKGEIWLKGDGTIVATNEGGSIEMSPAGVVSIGGSSDAPALSSILNRLLHVLQLWTPAAGDGGAALRTALTTEFGPTFPTSSSARLKVGG